MSLAACQLPSVGDPETDPTAMTTNDPIHPALFPPAMPLLESMVDVCLVYGIDETSARELSTSEKGDIHSDYESLLHKDVNLHFLQVLTPVSAYPDHLTRRKTWSIGRSQGGQNDGISRCGASPTKDSDLDNSFQSVQRKKFNIEKFRLPWEAVETVHWFMYPEGPQLSAEDAEPTIIPMMLTNIEGSRSYASGIRFYRPFFVQKCESSLFYKLIPWQESTPPPPDSRLIYLPTCVVLVSSKPYFQFQKDALSGFHRTLTSEEGDSSDSFWHCLQDYMERMFLVPAPPFGFLSVECKLPGFTSPHYIRPPRRKDHYLDLHLNYPFLCLSLDHVLEVVSALLTEQRIVFVSSIYPLLTYVIQCFFSYITPFDWRLPCVPILPIRQIDYLDAIGTNIMGCHSSTTQEQEFQSMTDVVIVDLDNDSVIPKMKETTPLPALPLSAVDIFRARYEVLEKNKFELEQLRQLSHVSHDHLVKEKAEFDRIQDTFLSDMFLELMVNIYANITEQIHTNMKFAEVLKTLPAKDQPFYKDTNQTDMFSAFYQKRKQGERDDFTLLAERLRRTQRKSIIPQEIHDDTTSSTLPLPAFSSTGRTSPLPYLGSAMGSILPGVFAFSKMGSAVSSMKHSVSFPPPSFEGQTRPHPFGPDESLLRSSSLWPQQQNSSEEVQLELPSLQGDIFSRDNFIKEVIESLSILAENKSVRAQCMYLRAYYLLCQGEFIQPLDDLFDNITKIEFQLRPSQSMKQRIYSWLSDDQKNKLRGKSYVKDLALSNKKAGTSCRRHQTVAQHITFNLDRKLPTKPLGINDFRKMVGENAISKDAETADNLFHILTAVTPSSATSIPPENFIAFYESWKATLQENAVVDLMNVELEKGKKRVKVSEEVIAVAEQARTPHGGQSMLVLTTYRFLAVTSFRSHVLADLRQSLQIDICDLPLGILPGSKQPGITIERGREAGSTQTEKKGTSERVISHRFVRARLPKPANDEMYAGFQTVWERDQWYRMLLEVHNGWKMAQARKDPAVMETVTNHVVLLEAISASGMLDRLNYTQRNRMIMKLMTLQTKDMSEVTQLTVDSLQYRINPCLHETDRQTVESLLYIPSLDPYEPGLGKLWIGLGNGSLKVYDMDAKCFESNIKITDSKNSKSLRLSCLLLVGQTVWVASFFSKNIHILDAETVCHVSQVSYLEEAPRDLALALLNEQEVVWSLLVNGTLLAFDPATRSLMCRMQIPVSDDNQFFTGMCFAVYKHLLWVGTNRGTVAIMDTEDGKCVKELVFFVEQRKLVEIKHLALSSQNEVWCSVNCTPRGEGSIFIDVFDPDTYDKKLHYTSLDSRVAVILPVRNTMWCGTRSGKIYIFSSENYSNSEDPKILSAHEDIIRTMTLADSMVVSGSGSNDGYAAVWRTLPLPE